LHTFDFTSERQRMTVIVKNLETGDIELHTKGADTIMHKIS
jgi:magnesium-transporting ATPase (P-type)